ncbi:MAG TPA: VOC family protein [Gemmatimonadota bacterium]|nr:VOC family protein [Gemmatimonadota bacterium]
MIDSLHHVALSVTDLDRAKHFYGEVLGLEELERPAFDFPGAWYGLGNGQLHLIVHSSPRSLRGTTQVDSRDGHFAVRVRDYDQAVARLLAYGVPMKESPMNVTPWSQIYVTDPDGNVIELNVERAGRRIP